MTTTLNSTIINLNMYDVQISESAEKHLADCKAFLESITDNELREKLVGTLQRCFETLERLGTKSSGAILYHDFAPMSFFFDAGGWCGGVIFHGPTNGSGPNYSVHLDQSFVGWSIHT